MIVVDTSVWIDFFAGHEKRPAVRRLVELVGADEAIGITDIILTEVLQGIRRDADVRRVDEELTAHEVLRVESLEDNRHAARLYRQCRRSGVTIRRTSDCLIAAVCIREGVPLLHSDRDFDALAAHTPLLTVPPRAPFR